MRKAILLLIISICFIACNKGLPQYTLSGNYENGGDTLYIFGLDYRHNHVDTIITNKKGYFEYNIKTDTLVPLTMVLSNGTMLPVYAEPDTKATLISNEHNYKIEGGTAQMLYDSITDILSNVKEKSQLYDSIDAFIKRHPLSEVNIHLIQKYFVETPDAKNSLIKQRIEYLGGTLQDNDYLSLIKTKINKKNSNTLRRAFPTYDYTTDDSIRITRNRYIGKYMLVTFWASWDSASVQHLKKLRSLEKLDTTYFAMLNISFDHDTAAWHRCMAKDSIKGDNVCDTKAWGSDLTKELTIERLPFSILVNTYQRIEEFNISTNRLEERLDSMIDKQKQKEKRIKKPKKTL